MLTPYHHNLYVYSGGYRFFLLPATIACRRRFFGMSTDVIDTTISFGTCRTWSTTPSSAPRLCAIDT